MLKVNDINVYYGAIHAIKGENMEYFSWLCRPIFTLSSTDRLLNSRIFWKVRAISGTPSRSP